MSLQLCKVGSSNGLVDSRETVRSSSSSRRTATGNRQDDPFMLAAMGGQSWVDRYRPSRSADLPVHHSKVRHNRRLQCHSLYLN